VYDQAFSNGDLVGVLGAYVFESQLTSLTGEFKKNLPLNVEPVLPAPAHINQVDREATDIVPISHRVVLYLIDWAQPMAVFQRSRDRKNRESAGELNQLIGALNGKY
jgi:hypothetical protein